MAHDLIPVCLKFGVTYQSIQVNIASLQCLEDLQSRAVEVVSKTIPDFDASDNQHRIKLFLISNDHIPPSLKLITRAHDLTAACFIEIVIWRSDRDSFVIPRDHQLQEHSYKKPTYCSLCNYFMWGLLKQGKRCRNCKRDFHHQCGEHLPPDCPGEVKGKQLVGRRTSSNSTLTSTISSNGVYVDGDLAHGGNVKIKGKKGSSGSLFNFKASGSSSRGSKTSLSCGGSKASLASLNSNTKMLTSLSPSAPDSSTQPNARAPRSAAAPNGPELTNTSLPVSTVGKQGRGSAAGVDRTAPPSRRTETTTSSVTAGAKPDRRKDIKLTNCQEKDGIWTAQGQFGRESRHSKRADIIYDKKKFQFIHKDEQGHKEIVELSVSDVEEACLREAIRTERVQHRPLLQDKSYRSQSSPGVVNGTSPVASDASGGRSRSGASTPTGAVSHTPNKTSEQGAAYQKLACLFLEMINEAAHSQSDRKARSSFKIVRGGTENASKDFEDLYDMKEKEILGVGRFGMVFGGTMRRNGVPVAIKKIKIEACTPKDKENIEQEAAYLFQLNHPGILKFEGIFDFEKHIFLVTERLETDMLNYILSNSNPKARLTEDTTRFLAFQLVAAIRYLHFKNIAHCDLKPDNVLINIIDEDIVHLKVGDFGYARTIHEHSLRYTKVGTTAYLPPEVSHDQWRHARGYNKTVDMWAIGVIIFVSLTGYFPFHEDVDILPQLDNIPKLFQDEILNKVTDDVKDLLRFRLLVPDAGHRMRSAGVIYHDWFQKSVHLLEACRRLEECLEKKWLTLFFEETESAAAAGVDESDSS